MKKPTPEEIWEAQRIILEVEEDDLKYDDPYYFALYSEAKDILSRAQNLEQPAIPLSRRKSWEEQSPTR